MLLTFKSKGTADINMVEAQAKRILDLLHKDVKMGVITAAEAPHAISVLEEVIGATRNHEASDAIQRDVQAHHNENDTHISFANRAYPLLDMLREAKKSNCDVLWGALP